MFFIIIVFAYVVRAVGCPNMFIGRSGKQMTLTQKAKRKLNVKLMRNKH
jgi:hypothetical protein